jgi:hypothetical protein
VAKIEVEEEEGMCRLASFIVTREKVLWHPSDDSHEKIIAYHHLDDKRKSDFVRVEMVPPNGDYFKPFTEWEFCIDQPTKPEWFSKKTEEEMVRAELPKWRKKRQFFYDAMEFVATIKDVPFFSGKGKILKAWKVFDTRAAAYAAACAAADDAAYDAAYAAAYDAAYDAARAAAYAAACAAAYDAARAAAYDAAYDAARAASLLARCIVVADKLGKKYMEHAKARWSVWQKGYGLLCDVGGVFYVYRKP